MELEAETKEDELEEGDMELEEGELTEEGELAGAVELEAEEGELEGPHILSANFCTFSMFQS